MSTLGLRESVNSVYSEFSAFSLDEFPVPKVMLFTSSDIFDTMYRLLRDLALIKCLLSQRLTKTIRRESKSPKFSVLSSFFEDSKLHLSPGTNRVSLTKK
jgi:hypothetical protein